MSSSWAPGIPVPSLGQVGDAGAGTGRACGCQGWPAPCATGTLQGWGEAALWELGRVWMCWAADLEVVQHHLGLTDALPQGHQGSQGLFPRWNQGWEGSFLLLPLLCALSQFAAGIRWAFAD